VRYEKLELILMKRFEIKGTLGSGRLPERIMQSVEANDQEGMERIHLSMIL
jgi:hypothetical protein